MNREKTERLLLAVLQHLSHGRDTAFTGFHVARSAETITQAKFGMGRGWMCAVIGYGTLYHALGNLQRRDLIYGFWSGEGETRRKYYRLVKP
jgi:hypothetical protein